MHVAKLMNMKRSAMDQQKNLHGTIIGSIPNSHHSRRLSHQIKTGPMAISDGFKISVGVSRRRQIHQGSPTNKIEFENLRSDANRTQELKSNLINQGEKILEKKLPISHEEENYYANKRVFTNLNKIAGDAGYNERS